MSFPRASIKRFNDESGCAPPPGTYDPKSHEKLQGVVLDVTDRFKESKAQASVTEITNSTNGTMKTPVKQFAVPQASQKPKEKKNLKSSSSVEASKIKELEQEVRKLCKEKTEKEKVISLKEDELKKIDGKLHVAVSERNSLQAKIASLEKELKEMKKSNEILKTKVSSSKTVSKKQEDLQHELTAVKQQLSTKDQDIAGYKQELLQLWNFLSNHLEMFETLTGSLETAVEAYRCTIGSLDEVNHEQKKTNKNTLKTKADPEMTTTLKDSTVKTDVKMKLCKKKSEALKTRFSAAVKEFETLTKTLKEKYSSVVKKHESLVKDLKETKNQLNDALENRKILEQQRDSLETEKSNLEKQNNQLTDKCNESDESHRSLMNQVDELLKNKEDIQTQLTDLQKAYQLSKTESGNKLKLLEDREVLMGDTTRNLHERIVELQAENEDLVATLKETGELLSKTKEHNMELEEMINEVEQKSENTKKQFLIQIEDLMFDKSRSESQLTEAQEQMKSIQESLVSQKSEAEQQIQTLTSELESKTMELSQLQDKLGNLVFEKSQLHTEIGHLEAQMKLIKSTSEQTKVEAEKALDVVPELMARLEEVNSEKTSVETKIKELKSENATLQKTLETFQSDFDEYVKQAEQDRLESQEKLLSQNDEIDGLKEQKDQMAKDLDDWLTDKTELDIEVAKLQCRIKVLEMEADQSRQEYEAMLKTQEAEHEKVKKEKCQIEKDMEQYGIDLLSNAAQLQTIQTQLNNKTKETEELETKYETLQETLSQKDLDLDQANKTIIDMKEAHSSKTKESEELETKYKTLQETLSQKELDLDQANKTISYMKETHSSKESDYEKLLEETDSLEEELRLQRDINEDLQSQIQQIRTDFIKRCDERDDLMKKNTAKDNSLAILSTQVSDMTSQMESLTQTLTQKTSECETLSKKLSETEDSLSISSKQVSNYKQQIEDYLEHLQLKCDECDELQQRCEELDSELTISAKEIVELTERVEEVTRDSTDKSKQLLQKYETQIEELKAQLSSVNVSTEMEEELARYKSLYEELQAKVEPFIEQINAFELEKQTLLGMNKNTQAEMDKLSTDYARLLGHQNQKQKIKHIMKIKEENSTLKNETMQLRAQITKQRQTIKKLEEKNAPKRFDPSKAFTTTKENVSQSERPKTPLKDANRK